MLKFVKAKGGEKIQRLRPGKEDKEEVPQHLVLFSLAFLKLQYCPTASTLLIPSDYTSSTFWHSSVTVTTYCSTRALDRLCQVE